MKSEICVYCGGALSAANRTKDHTPPKILFFNRPSDLITVPACKTCNQGASKDDEHFCLVITARLDTEGQPEADRVSAKVLRSLEREQSAKFLDAIVASLTTVDVQTPGDVLLGVLPGYNVDMERVRRVVARTTKGLFFHEFGRPLPQDHAVSVFMDSPEAVSRMQQATPEVVEKIRQQCARLQSKPGRALGDGVFSYWFDSAAGEPNTTIWVMAFYQRVGFISMTAPAEKLPRRS